MDQTCQQNDKKDKNADAVLFCTALHCNHLL